MEKELLDPDEVSPRPVKFEEGYPRSKLRIDGEQKTPNET